MTEKNFLSKHRICNRHLANMRYLIFAFPLLAAFSTPADAQVYKCKDKKGGTVYSDTPCDLTGGNSVIVVPKSSPPPASQVSSFTPHESSHARQLDIAVRRSIANNDLDRASSIAVTPQHWEWIASAKNNDRPRSARGRTEADLSAEKGESWACQIATREYNFEASSYKQVKNTIDAKRSMMHAACGIKEPTRIEIDNRAVIYQRVR